MSAFRIKACDFYTRAANRKYGPFGALLLDWMNTTPATNLAGFLDVAADVMAFESMVPADQVERLLKLFAEDGRIMRTGDLIWITEFAQDQWATIPGPTQIRAIQKALIQIGLDHPLVLAFDDRYAARWGSAWPADFIIHPDRILGRTHGAKLKKRTPAHD